MPKAKTVLVLRTCAADMTSHGGQFRWKRRGIVEAPDWSPEKVCGRGLHGFLWGEGDGSLASWDPDAKWLVVEVAAKSFVDLDGKVKFPRGKVVHCGDRLSATAYIAEHGAAGRAIVGGTAVAGNYRTATAGYGGTATAGHGGTATTGDYGTATAGHSGTAVAGYGGTATAGCYGTAVAGNRGTATAGDCGTIQIRYHDGRRYRAAVGDIGENGLVANVPYYVVEGKLTRK